MVDFPAYAFPMMKNVFSNFTLYDLLSAGLFMRKKFIGRIVTERTSAPDDGAGP